MLTKLLEYTNNSKHRLILWVSLWMVFTWILVIPQLRFNWVLLSMNGVLDLQGLIAVKDLSFAGRLIAQALDQPSLIHTLLYSTTLLDAVTFSLGLLLCSKTDLKPRLRYYARFNLAFSLLGFGLILGGFGFAYQAVNPNQVLLVFQTVGWLSLSLALAQLITPFAAWVDLIFFS